MHVCQELNNVGRPGTRYPSGLYNDDATPFLTSSVAHENMLTCIMRIVRISCMNNRQRSLKLPLTLAPPRADSTNQPTHWATPCTGPQPVHWHATVSSRVHVQRLLCAWQVQACVTVRHVRVRVAGGAGAAGAAHATNSVRHARCSDRRPVSGRVF